MSPFSSISGDATTRPAKFLVVDHDPVMLRLLARVLEQAGYDVQCTDQGANALHMILQDCPDVLLTDREMTGLDGLELCRRVRRLYAGKVLPHYVNILVLSEESGSAPLVQAFEAGADDFIRKDGRVLSDPAEFEVELLARLRAGLRPRRVERALVHAAQHDALTQLLNRATFFKQAAFVWERSVRNKFPLSAVMIDCDYFKRVNDVYGHQAGDTVLRECAAVIRKHIRVHDLAGRYGGEEFCLLLPNCTEATAWTLTERIRSHIEKTPFQHGNVQVSMTASFGVAERSAEMSSLEQLLERADEFLRVAKESGRNRCGGAAVAMQHGLGVQRLARFLNTHIVRDVMTPFPAELPLVTKDATVSEVVARMLADQSELMPVTDQQGNLAGALSIVHALSLVDMATRWNAPVATQLSPHAVCYQHDAPLRILYEFFSRTTLPCVIVLDGKRPIGYVTGIHLLEWAMQVCRDSDITTSNFINASYD